MAIDKDRLNGSGCRDDTAYYAIRNASGQKKTDIIRYDETERDKEANELVRVVKKLIRAYGFRLSDRIRFEDPDTGKKYV